MIGDAGLSGTAALPRVRQIRVWSLERWTGIFVCALTLLLIFYRLGTMGLLDPEEGRYAEIPREMILTGDWITPHLDHMRYLEKPPLLYWLIAVTYRLAGESELTARLGSALPGLLGILVVFLWARAVVNWRAASLSALVLLTSPEYFSLARSLETDMLFTVCFSGALLCAYRGAMHETDGTRYCRWMWVAAALAMLAKSPVAVGLLLIILAVFLLLIGEPRRLGKLDWRVGALLFLALATPWFIVVSLRNPDFIHFYWWEQHFQRFFTHKARLVQPQNYYVWVLERGFAPWLALLPVVALQHCWRLRRRALAPYFVFLWCWAVIIFAFFTYSEAKLPTYILPMYPALALLVGIAADEWIAAMSSVMLRWCLTAVFGVTILGMSAFYLRFYNTPFCLWFASYSARYFVVSPSADPARVWEPCRTMRPMAQLIARNLRPRDKVVEYRCYVPSIAYYTHRRFIIAGSPNELSWAKNSDGGGGYFWTGRLALKAWLRRPVTLYCIAPRKRFVHDLRRPGFERIRVMRWGPEYVLFTNQPPGARAAVLPLTPRYLPAH